MLPNSIQRIAATNSSSHSDTLTTNGYLGTVDSTATRSKNNQDTSQTQTVVVSSLTSAGNITTQSGGDTLIQASTLNALGSIDLSATGYAASTNADGTTNAGRSGTITFAAMKDSNYTSVTDSSSSQLWQSQSGSGSYTETLKLANISAGKGLSVNAAGGIAIDIPVVAATPAPAPTTDAKGKIVKPVPLTAAQQAAQQQADLNKSIQNLSSQPGQAWIGQLVNDPKLKVKLQQVTTAAQHWDYSSAGLTPAAAALVVIVVTYFTAGSATTEAAAITGTATTSVATAAVAAGITTLASQAAVSIINNQGDLGKTLNDMGQSQNIKALVTAMVTAGALSELNQAVSVGGNSLVTSMHNRHSPPCWQRTSSTTSPVP
jgi:filamentous hemagglutinin